MRAGFDGAFFGMILEGVGGAGSVSASFAVRGLEVAGVDGGRLAGAGAAVECPFPVLKALASAALGTSAGVLISGGSEEGGSEPMLGLSGVRNGDLNGLLSVFAASFSRRRLACGVDIVRCTWTLVSRQ